MTFNPSKRQALGRSFVARDSVAATQSTFFGTKAPAEVTQLALLLPNTDQATFIKLLKFVLEYIKGTEVINCYYFRYLLRYYGSILFSAITRAPDNIDDNDTTIQTIIQ